ncbi:MAG: 5'-nucleotidase C-terminal domain-containing protein [Deltaproteobacteria bacterium]|nr:5'-nucleotidase C-terminal domain-containing protein [Deltaproteobacteria bacterium]
MKGFHWTIALVTAAFASASGCDGDKTHYELTVLHTNDRHSHWLGLSNSDYFHGEGETVGGAERWMGFVEQTRQAGGDVLLLDSGDFTMGTLFVAAQEMAADLNGMHEMGFDAACLGNHEFDWGPAALARMIGNAAEPRVPLVCANIQFDPGSPADDALEALYGPEGESGKAIHEYIVRSMPSGLKVGIFGLMGLDAAEVVPQKAPVAFSKNMTAMVETAQAVADKLREEEKVDLVLVLAHLGILENDQGEWVGETIDLARRTTGIDAILSGHAHTPVDGGVQVASEVEGSDWSTLVMEAGSFGRQIGRWHFTLDGDARSAEAELVEVDSTLPDEMPAVTEFVSSLIQDLEEHFLALYPIVPDPDAFLTGTIFQPLAISSCDIIRHRNECNNLGNLVADAARRVTGSEVCAISNGGDIRESLMRDARGEFSLSDAFITTPLGIGPDGLLGYPLVCFYLNWSDFKFVLEGTTCDMGQGNNDYLLNLSGVRIAFDMDQPSFIRIDEIDQYTAIDESDQAVPIFRRGEGDMGWLVDDTQLVHICSSLYIASFASSMGIELLDETGQVQSDLSSLIALDGEGHEIKLWYAFTSYLASFADGVPDLYCDGVSSSHRRCVERNPD